MTTTRTHDETGRLVVAFLAGERATGLPRGAALEAFRRHHSMGEVDYRGLRAVLTITERAFIAAELANMSLGGDRGNQHTGGKTPGGCSGTDRPLVSRAEAASTMAQR